MQAWCSANSGCGGVTQEASGRYTARSGTSLKDNAGENSWLCKRYNSSLLADLLENETLTMQFDFQQNEAMFSVNNVTLLTIPVNIHASQAAHAEVSVGIVGKSGQEPEDHSTVLIQRLSVSVSSSCFDTSVAGAFGGTTSTTRSGRPCQRWNASLPHAVVDKPDDAREGHAYCRVIDAVRYPEGPWCYTLDQAVEWEYCSVPVCGECPASTLVIGHGLTGIIAEVVVHDYVLPAKEVWSQSRGTMKTMEPWLPSLFQPVSIATAYWMKQYGVTTAFKFTKYVSSDPVQRLDLEDDRYYHLTTAVSGYRSQSVVFQSEAIDTFPAFRYVERSNVGFGAEDSQLMLPLGAQLSVDETSAYTVVMHVYVEESRPGSTLLSVGGSDMLPKLSLFEQYGVNASYGYTSHVTDGHVTEIGSADGSEGIEVCLSWNAMQQYTCRDVLSLRVGEWQAIVLRQHADDTVSVVVDMERGVRVSNMSLGVSLERGDQAYIGGLSGVPTRVATVGQGLGVEGWERYWSFDEGTVIDTTVYGFKSQVSLAAGYVSLPSRRGERGIHLNDTSGVGLDSSILYLSFHALD